ncbi:uncharacterized protein B0H18DRAFT_1022221 [Fomitopsis serialis]|uniref:uncharacterized protein n=1 Tax=Fomitopsis serialis TaxID=139415 RepID=UPI002008BE12|nr:uncharacterized protein B0H18DRAFT_1022221 [Neoantrodia serialis]KAH9921155.1 hypothetical protein B0H18DRAFT_1022221 [Neoantrodia serialis]
MPYSSETLCMASLLFDNGTRARSLPHTCTTGCDVPELAVTVHAIRQRPGRYSPLLCINLLYIIIAHRSIVGYTTILSHFLRVIATSSSTYQVRQAPTQDRRLGLELNLINGYPFVQQILPRLRKIEWSRPRSPPPVVYSDSDLNGKWVTVRLDDLDIPESPVESDSYGNPSATASTSHGAVLVDSDEVSASHGQEAGPQSERLHPSVKVSDRIRRADGQRLRRQTRSGAESASARS